MTYPFQFRILRAGVSLMLMLASTAIPSEGRDNAKPIFEQDLQLLGYSFRYEKNDEHIYRFTDLAFLSDELLLVAVKEISVADRGLKTPPSCPPTLESPLAGHRPPTSLATLLVFNVDQNKLVHWARLPDRRMENAATPAQPGYFFLLSGYGLQLCSADLKCRAPLPNGAPIFSSTRGTRAMVTGPAWDEQQLLDTATFSVLETFKKGTPKIVPGDVGLLFQKYPTTTAQMPGREQVDLRVDGSDIFPQARFLDDNRVVGMRNRKATVIAADGTMLYQIDVKAWEMNVRFVTTPAGSRFGIAELQRLNPVLNFFDINTTRDYDRVQFRVFDVASGKQLLDLKWDPRHYGGADILPALSPSGHRAAVVRKGMLQVYEVP